MRGIARTCSCGLRIEPGQTCPRCPKPKRDERARGQQRRHYKTAEYRRNRRSRYLMVGGRCETCGVPIIGELWSEQQGAVRGECDHVVELVDGGTNDVENLRWRCDPCHDRKTAALARARRARRQ